MTTEIRVPTLGESVSEATIGRWFKKTGDAVKADEPLLELETDKVTLEVNAPASGVLAEIVAKDGETVGVGALLGQISNGAAAPAPVKGDGKAAAPSPSARREPRRQRPLRKPPLRHPPNPPWRLRQPPPKSPLIMGLMRPPFRAPAFAVRF